MLVLLHIPLVPSRRSLHLNLPEKSKLHQWFAHSTNQTPFLAEPDLAIRSYEVVCISPRNYFLMTPLRKSHPATQMPLAQHVLSFLGHDQVP